MSDRGAALVRWLAWLFAGCLIVATLLFFGLTSGWFAKPPTFPDSADLPTRLLGSVDFNHAIWPFDLASSLIYAAGFAGLLALAGVLGSAAPAPGRRVMVTAFAGAALLVIASQLIHVGAHQVAIDVPYCDCGFKVQESISQAWGLMLIDGAQSWLVNGGSILLAIGIALAGSIFGGFDRDWRVMSYLTSSVIIVAVAVSVIGLSDAAGTLTNVGAGVVIPVWAVWLGFAAPNWMDRSAAPSAET